MYAGDTVNTPDPVAHTVYFSRADRSASRIIGLADVNGDGRDDIITGGPAHDSPTNSGIIEVTLGHAAGEPGTTTLVCENVLSIPGQQSSGGLGLSGLGLGDLDGDGCEEFVVGEPRKRVEGRNDAGAALLVFGWGGPGCPANPRQVKFNAGRDAQFEPFLPPNLEPTAMRLSSSVGPASPL